MTACQRCSQPLRLDASLSQGLGQSAFDMIASSLPEASTSYAPSATSASPLSRLPSALQSAYTNRSGPAASRKVVAAPPGRVQPSLAAARPSWPNGPPAESYVLLSDSQVRPPAASVAGKGKQAEGEGQEDYGPRSLSKDLARTHALFDLVSAHSDIDHPLCTECGAVLAALMDRQLADAKRERERYLAYERDLAGALSSTAGKGKGNADVERGRMEKEIRRLEAEEAQAIEDLKAAERERVKLDEELAALELEESALAAEEEQFWIEHATYTTARDRLVDQARSVQTRYERDLRELERLQRSNVLDDAFHIVINDSSASINGLRFGKTSKAPLEWPEFNAAWGHILLLLATLARRLGHDFNGYRLVPMASFSRIENLVSKTTYGLYGTGDIAIGSFLHTRRLNDGMIAFLECLRQVVDLASAEDASLRFPYVISKDKIGDKSIKQPQIYDDAEWSMALAHVLQTLSVLKGARCFV